jgi:hypothetical protein
MQGRPFFEVAAQLAAVLTALPIVGVLAFTILEAVSAYPFTELRIRLLTLVRDDLRRTLEHEPANRPRDEPARRKKGLARIEKELVAYDVAALERGRTRSEEFISRLLAAVDGPPIFAGLEERARRQAELCEQRFASWLRRAVPLAVVRHYQTRLAAAATAWLVIRTLRDHYREGDTRVAGLRWSLLAVLASVETFQLLLYFGVLDS